MIQLLFHEKRIYLGQYHWCCCFQGTGKKKLARSWNLSIFLFEIKDIFSNYPKVAMYSVSLSSCIICSCMEVAYETHSGKCNGFEFVLNDLEQLFPSKFNCDVTVLISNISRSCTDIIKYVQYFLMKKWKLFENSVKFLFDTEVL